MTSQPHSWGSPPWKIDFRPPPRALPARVDFAVIGGGFTGLAAAAWLRLLAPEKSVAVLEAFRIGAGASGRTGGMALAETAAGASARPGRRSGRARKNSRKSCACSAICISAARGKSRAAAAPRACKRLSNQVERFRHAARGERGSRRHARSRKTGERPGARGAPPRRRIYENHRVASVDWSADARNSRGRRPRQPPQTHRRKNHFRDQRAVARRLRACARECTRG